MVSVVVTEPRQGADVLQTAENKFCQGILRLQASLFEILQQLWKSSVVDLYIRSGWNRALRDAQRVKLYLGDPQTALILVRHMQKMLGFLTYWCKSVDKNVTIVLP